MKINFISITKIWKPASFVACSLILFSCEKENTPFPSQEKVSSNATELIEKIETAYVEGVFKDETTPTAQLETRASDEYLLSVQNKIEAYFQNFESRYRIAAEYDGYSVGVVPDTDNCGTEERIRYFMDNQDGGNTVATGWTGAWSVDGNKNTWHTLCRVDGRLFKFLHLTPRVIDGAPERKLYYGLVRLGNLRPNHMYYYDPYIVHHDSEDSNNKNISTPGQVVSNDYIHRDTNGFALQFWIGYGWNNDGESQGYIHEFPNLGFSYGVFSESTNSESLANGTLYVDDENSGNANTLTKGGTSFSSILGNGVTRVSDSGNTRYNFMKVR